MDKTKDQIIGLIFQALEDTSDETPRVHRRAGQIIYQRLHDAGVLSPAAPAWQPIETAPKDGTVIILSRFAWLTDISDLGDNPSSGDLAERFFDSDAPKVYHHCWTSGGFWSSKYNNWNDGEEPSGLASPSHWIPLPAIALARGEGVNNG